MRILLDTHTFLWRLLDDQRLSKTANELIDDTSNELFLSSVSGFEIAAKVAIGKLKLPLDVIEFVHKGMEQNQIVEMPLALRHTYGVAKLPLLHRDPFDRLLICQALEEELIILTSDDAIRGYAVKFVW